MSDKAKHDELVKALYEGRTNRPYDRELAKTLPKSAWGYLHKEAMWFDDALEATPDQVRGFYNWYRRTYPDLSLPQVHDTIEREWANFLLDVVHAMPEKRLQTGPDYNDLDNSWRDKPAVPLDDVLASNPELAERVNALIGNLDDSEQRMVRRLRKPSDKKRTEFQGQVMNFVNTLTEERKQNGQ